MRAKNGVYNVYIASPTHHPTSNRPVRVCHRQLSNNRYYVNYIHREFGKLSYPQVDAAIRGVVNRLYTYEHMLIIQLRTVKDGFWAF